MQIILQNTGGKPIYEQITEQMKAQILSGVIPAGEQLPSIRTLAKDLRVSVITTKRAYEELEREGFVETMQGRGTYVSHQDTEQVREEHLRRIEQKLLEAVEIAKSAGISEQEMCEALHLLFGGDER
ncbi:GntR family transcriptional regulator [Butyricicoccus sp.]|uniref:GntR family transcriptional regulator n=1 Tax=Butyricicoccus sp. TaxID=2049021 RepID=UPI003D7E9B97